MDTLPLHGNRQRSAFRLSPEQKTLALILGALALRIVFAAAIGLGVDESYTVATARVLSLSTFDHPPAAWWLTHFAASLFGESPLALRAPFLLLFVLTSWLMFVLTRRLFGAQAGFYATLALNLSPVLGLTDASWILPDAPLLPAMTLPSPPARTPRPGLPPSAARPGASTARRRPATGMPPWRNCRRWARCGGAPTA